MQKVRPLPGEVCLALTIVNTRNNAKGNLPNLAQPLWRTLQQEKKKQSAGQNISQRAQKYEQVRPSNNGGNRNACELQASKILIVHTRRIQQYNGYFISSLVEIHRVIHHGFVGAADGTCKTSLTKCD